jgi:hypothetical protein
MVWLELRAQTWMDLDAVDTAGRWPLITPVL